jgi:Ubiquitin-activating enzyme E1 FCCH domain
MDMLSDIITYVRRIIKSPSNASITDNLIIDYINRFVLNDVQARMQLFDFKTKYQFQTQPGVDRYNMPLYNVQATGTPPASYTGPIAMFPVYQGFLDPVYINGIQVPFQTDKTTFFNIWPNIVQQSNVVAIGNGTPGPYSFSIPISPINSTPLNAPVQAILRGHVDITGIMATGNNVDPPLGTNLNTLIPSTSIYPAVYFTATNSDGSNIVIQDSGQFLSFPTNATNYGMLMEPGPAPFEYSALSGGYTNSFTITGITQANPAVITATTTFAVGQTVEITNVAGMTQLNGNTYTVIANSGPTLSINVDSTSFSPYLSGGLVTSLQNVINYLTGAVTNVFFPVSIPFGADITAQCFFFQCGLPRGVLFNNNTLTLRSPPDTQYLVELDAYLTPAAFLNTSNAIPFGYMSEYIARGAARKILTDTGDVEQFQFYEPLFLEQEYLVWKRSQRQFTASRTQTIYSQGINQGQSGFNNLGGSTL